MTSGIWNTLLTTRFWQIRLLHSTSVAICLCPQLDAHPLRILLLSLRLTLQATRQLIPFQRRLNGRLLPCTNGLMKLGQMSTPLPPVWFMQATLPRWILCTCTMTDLRMLLHRIIITVLLMGAIQKATTMRLDLVTITLVLSSTRGLPIQWLL